MTNTNSNKLDQMNQINRRRMNFMNENGLRLAFLFICFLTASWTSVDQTVIAQKQKLPLVINTWKFVEATQAGWSTLNGPNGNVLDAVEKGCSTCELMQCDGSVGFGSHPDEDGTVTLDAMIMDGDTQNVGAVAQMHGIKSAISVARKVLEHSQHTLLVGHAATSFASRFGFLKEALENENSKKQHDDWLHNNCQPNFWINMLPDPSTSCGPYKPRNVADEKSSAKQPDFANNTLETDIRNHDTIGMIAIDSNGNIATGTSTNGAMHKIPGRVGDSSIPGSGSYADNNFGAAVSTGDGDVIMRFSPARSAVQYLEQGKTTSEAAELALVPMQAKFPENQAAIVVANHKGDYSAACFGMSKFVYTLRNSLSDEVQVKQVDCFDRPV